MGGSRIEPLDYHLTTAWIFYRLPDYPGVLQEFLWQDYDIAPKFPELHKFLDFWTHRIEGSIHSVQVASKTLIKPADLKYYDGEITLQ